MHCPMLLSRREFFSKIPMVKGQGSHVLFYLKNNWLINFETESLGAHLMTQNKLEQNKFFDRER